MATRIGAGVFPMEWKSASASLSVDSAGIGWISIFRLDALGPESSDCCWVVRPACIC